MDTIQIHELKIETIIGCLAWERQIKQAVIFDLTISLDNCVAGQSDNLKDTVNYCEIASCLTQFVEQSQCKLLEALAEQSAKLLIDKFNITKLRLDVKKIGAIKNAKAVSVSIERS